MDVSVIIPVYNAERYLEECMISLLRQETEFDFELIFINDGSTDGSLKILEKHQDKCQIIDGINQGPGAARNSALEIAKGKYLMFADADDVVDKHFIDAHMKTILKYDADIVVSDFYRLKGSKKEFVDKGSFGIYEKGNISEVLLMEFHSVNKIFKKSVFVKYPEKMFFEDVVAIALSELQAKRIVKIEGAYYYYRFVDESTTNTLSGKAYDILKATDLIEPYLIKERYGEVMEFLYINNILVDLCIKILKSKSNPKDEVYSYLDYANDKYPNWKKNKYIKRSRIMKRAYLFLLRNRIYVIIRLIYRKR